MLSILSCVLAIPRFFNMNFTVNISISAKKPAGILPYCLESMGNIVILTILKLITNENEMIFHLFISYYSTEFHRFNTTFAKFIVILL